MEFSHYLPCIMHVFNTICLLSVLNGKDYRPGNICIVIDFRKQSETLKKITDSPIVAVLHAKKIFFFNVYFIARHKSSLGIFSTLTIYARKYIISPRYICDMYT